MKKIITAAGVKSDDAKGPEDAGPHELFNLSSFPSGGTRFWWRTESAYLWH